MSTYLIEVPHGEDRTACVNAIKVFMESGSHFLTNAEWGCSDDVHKALMIVDVEDKEQALQIVPPSFRADARVTKLFKVTREDVEQYKEGSIEKDPVKYHK